MKGTIIELEGISKQYHKKVLFERIDLAIAGGQSVSFTGHNGIGKSTLLKIMSGLVRPDSGRVIKSPGLLFHYIPEHFPGSHLTASQYIRAMGRIDGMGKKETADKSSALFQRFFMEAMQDIPMKQLSKGSLQKVGVIQALLREPDVLLLDEPLSGQDADSQEVFVHEMNRLREKGVTLLMSCHEPDLIRKISDTVYELSDKKLRGICPEQSAPDCDILYLEPPGGQEAESVRLPYPSRKSGSQIKLSVPSEESNAFLLSMLSRGWKLRRMYHENNP